MANLLKITIRAAINILLVAAFIFTEVYISRLLLAEVSSNYADKFAGTYEWDKAEEGFRKAISLDPYNSRYYAGFGEMMFKEALQGNNKIIYLSRAKVLYEEALKLNPGYAEYALRLGQISFLLPDITERAKSAFGYFRTALANDPNGFNISYSVGYAGISAWKFLDKQEKEFILSRLKYSLKLNPSYSKYIYPKLWNETMDLDLLRSIRPPGRGPNKYITRLERLESIRSTAGRTLNVANVIIESDWQGRANDKKNIYVNGNMYWAGTMDAAIRIPPGKSIIKIQAKGSPADGIFPRMMVELDGRMIGEAYIKNNDWRSYEFKINTDGGIKVLSVSFLNDSSSKNGKEDRNLYIGIAKAI